MTKQDKIIQILLKKGYEKCGLPLKEIEFSSNDKADILIKNSSQFPHAFVLACIMDRQIKTEKAWLIPYSVSQEIGGFEFKRLLKLNSSSLKEIFKKRNLHRFNNKMAGCFHSAIQLIHTRYNDDASKIWKDKPLSATVVKRFLEFEGVGVKISTMAANILARDFKIPMQDRTGIDISPDAQVQRVFTRLGFISKDAKKDELIYSAKELHPEYPGIFDCSVWEIGRDWCKPHIPECKKCYLNEFCPKNI